jgi:hypothetical protein
VFIQDAIGRTVDILEFHNAEFHIHVGHYPPGIYMLVPADRDNLLPLTFVKN